MGRFLFIFLALAPCRAFATEPRPDTTCRDQAAWGYLDKTGATTIAPQFRTATPFAGGLAAVQSKEGTWGYVDKKGAWAIPARFEYAEPFSEGLACVREQGKLAVVDETGKTRLTGLTACYRFAGGLARLEKDGKAGYHDASGKLVLPVDADDISTQGDFSGGRASFYEKSWNGWIACGLVDEKGARKLAETKLPCLGVHDLKEGRARLFVKHGEQGMRVGFVDADAKVVVPPAYEDAGDYHEGLAAVKKGDRWGFVDLAGKTVVPLAYDYVSMSDRHDGMMDDYPRFSDGLAMLLVGRGAKQHAAYLDKAGKVAVDAKGAVLARDFHDGLAYVLWEDRSGFIDKSGKLVIDAKPLRETQDFSEGLAAVCRPK